MFRIMIVTAAGLLLLSACDLLGPEQACEAIQRRAVWLTVISSVDGSPVTEGLTGTLKDGSYIEEMRPSFNRFFGGTSRPGNYTITITATGFEPWVMSDIRVHRNECGEPATRILTAEMIPKSLGGTSQEISRRS